MTTELRIRDERAFAVLFVGVKVSFTKKVCCDVTASEWNECVRNRLAVVQ
jgi:hypothetical protein